ncbi:MAG TPA: hypothetical protein VFM14_14340 [Gemmatimonadales bacterium]|nr:hypothetical protein [Gemmatimonadales bacterium]
MALKPCTDCGREVSTLAERCPNCGLKNPTRLRGEDDRGNLLVDLSKLRGPTITCRDCGVEVRAGAPACPSCGRPNPGDSGRRWMGWAALLTASIFLAAVAWLYLIPGRAEQPAPTVSGFTARDTRRRLGEPPRLQSDTFPADCARPASVYVYEPSKPAEFIVLLAGSVRNPAAIADSLSRLYGAGTGEYDPGRRGFVATLSDDAVSGLRCEPAVASLEEYPEAR